MLTIPCKTILQKNKTSEWFGNDYNMNLYRGCCHGCIYCDSRSECYHVDNFDTVRAKENALAILRDELRRKIRKGIIGTGAMSDPYNPFEQTELLTRHALELISAYEFGITVITKSPLITRDIDVYNEISEHSPILCKMTVTTADDELCRLIEPNVAPSSERFNALAKCPKADCLPVSRLCRFSPFSRTARRIYSESSGLLTNAVYGAFIRFSASLSGRISVNISLMSLIKNFRIQNSGNAISGVSETGTSA